MEDYDTGKQDFDDNKVCLENVSNGNYSLVEFHFYNTFYLMVIFIIIRLNSVNFRLFNPRGSMENSEDSFS